jgi:predicted Zn-dependent protease
MINYLTLALQQQSQGQDATQAANMAKQKFDLAESEMLSTIAFVRPEYDNYVFLANLYNLGGQYFDSAYYDKALEIAKRGIEVEPYGPAIRYQYAQALSSTGKVDEAIKELKYALGLDTNFKDGAILLASIYQSQGKIADARAVLDAAANALRSRQGTLTIDLAQAIADLEASATPGATATP